MTVQVNVQEAKTRLSQILAEVEGGEDVVIARDGKPVARLVAVGPLPPRPVGFLQGPLPDTFFDPLPPEELEQWS